MTPKEIRSLTHWNYRVVKTYDQNGTPQYGVYECYWTNDQLITRTESSISSVYDDLDDLREDIEAIKAALDLEPIEEKDDDHDTKNHPY